MDEIQQEDAAVEVVAEEQPPAVEPTPVVEVVEEIQVEEPEVAPAKKIKNSAPLKGAGVFVNAAALEYPTHRKNSGSVTSIQVRLIELGYSSAGDDLRGHFGSGTCVALCAFRKDKNIEADRCFDFAVISSLFSGTAVEVLA